MFAGKHFQNAYVCDDIDAALEAFKAAGLEKEPRIMHSNGPANTPDGIKNVEMKVAIFRLNVLTYEIIQPINDETGVYANAKDNGGAVRFHHTCCRVDDGAALRADVEKSEFPVAMEYDTGEGQVKAVYLDARAKLGHYIEFTWMPESMWRGR